MAGDRVAINLGTAGYDVTEGLAVRADAHGDGSVRRFSHGGRTIEIETHYRITIDGVTFPDHIHVAANGTVHYHGLPQYSTPSAVDLVRRIVDRMDDAAPPPLLAPDGDGGAPGGGHGGGDDDRPHGQGRSERAGR